ncbi:hypothetical protein DJ51_5538 [Bacillus cereus]|nr:hypothetical protein DJ51_5538 [Bacillus cereus]
MTLLFLFIMSNAIDGLMQLEFTVTSLILFFLFF